MQTINAISHQRNSIQIESTCPYINTCEGKLSKKETTEIISECNDHPRNSYETRARSGKENCLGTTSACSLRGSSSEKGLVVKPFANDDAKEKKKDKKWSLGGFFKRKSKKNDDDDDDLSDDCEDDGRNRFLYRQYRKYRKETRKSKSKGITNGFDVIISPMKDSKLTVESNKKDEFPWQESPKFLEKFESGNGSVRYNYRHRSAFENNTLNRNKNNILQVLRHHPEDSNQFRLSEGSETFDGRNTRKEVMARAEAKRGLICDESSSDEYESNHSNSSLNRGGGDYPGCRRLRRNKRSSRDDVSIRSKNENDLKMVKKSDAEVHRKKPAFEKYTSKTCQLDTLNDREVSRTNLMNHSTASSPSRSPRTRPKQLPNYATDYRENSYSMKTFPPVAHHFQQSKRSAFMSSDGKVSQFNRLEKAANYTNENVVAEKISRVLNVDGTAESVSIWPSPDGSGALSNENVFYFEDAKRNSSFPSKQYTCSVLPLRSQTLEASSPIHRPLHAKEIRIHGENLASDWKSSENSTHSSLKRNFENSVRVCANQNEVTQNRTSSVASLCLQPGSFPRSQTQNVHRSASGNTFSALNENTRRFYPNRSNSFQHIPTYLASNLPDCGEWLSERTWSPSEKHHSAGTGIEDRFFKSPNVPTNTLCTTDGNAKSHFNNISNINKGTTVCRDAVLSKMPFRNGTTSLLRYYADQNPRSRNPIHIMCNPVNINQEQSYLSDSQIGLKTMVDNISKDSKNDASDCLKIKDQKINLKYLEMKKNEKNKDLKTSREAKGVELSPTKSKNVSNLGEKMIESESVKPVPLIKGVECGNNEKENKMFNFEERNKIPPDPPIRRLSKQEVLERLHKCQRIKILQDHALKSYDSNNNKNLRKENLEDVLNELEIIYESLRLHDEDLLDGAERRDYKTNCSAQLGQNTILSDRSKENNHNCEHDKVLDSANLSNFATDTFPGNFSPERNALPTKRFAVPDKVLDDMAVRRMKINERPDLKKFPSPSYLRSSPAFSPGFGENSIGRRDSPVGEPDITKDDLVFRNIRHANSTLKIQDPQPPFGIPIGVIAPAANSDYLHATPKDRFRPTFTSSKTPDVVKDDLAFRNLRKDNKTSNSKLESKPFTEIMIKKKAVRSHSANIHNIMKPRKGATHAVLGPDANLKTEKALSLTDLPFETSNNKEGSLEELLRALKKKNIASKTEFFELIQPSEKRRFEREGWNVDGIPFENLGKLKSEKSENSMEFFSLPGISEPKNRTEPMVNKNLSYPIVKLSKYPAAAPESTLPNNPFKDASALSSVDEEHLERVLSSLAMEALHASKDLERQLDELEIRKLSSRDFENVSGETDAEVLDSPSSENKANSIVFSKSQSQFSLVKGERERPKMEKKGSSEEAKEFARGQLSENMENLSSNRCSRGFCEEKIFSKQKEVARDSGALVCTEEDGRLIRKLPETSESSLTNEKISDYASEFDLTRDLNHVLNDIEWELFLNNNTSVNGSKKEDSTTENDVFQQIYEYNCNLPNANGKVAGNDSKGNEFINAGEKMFAPIEKPPPSASEKSEKDFEDSEKVAKETDYAGEIDENWGRSSMHLQRKSSLAFADMSRMGTANRRGGRQDEASSRQCAVDGKGEMVVKPTSFKSEVWLACSYALAFAFCLQEIDFITALGLVLAFVSLLAIFIL